MNIFISNDIVIYYYIISNNINTNSNYTIINVKINALEQCSNPRLIMNWPMGTGLSYPLTLILSFTFKQKNYYLTTLMENKVRRIQK